MRVLQRSVSVGGFLEDAPVHLPKEKRPKAAKVAQTAGTEVTQGFPKIAKISAKVTQATSFVAQAAAFVTQGKADVAIAEASVVTEAAGRCRLVDADADAGPDPEAENNLSGLFFAAGKS